MQRQPTPVIDPDRPGHFLVRDDAIEKLGTEGDALTNLTDLPSQKNEDLKEEQRQHSERDKRLNITLKLRSWENKKSEAF